jgi:hypothetical protein
MTIFLWLGVSLLSVVLAYLVFEDWQFMSRTRRHVYGTVFDHRRSTDDGSEFFSAMVRFETHEGQVIEFTDTFGRRSRQPAAGSQLEVIYPVGLAEKARVNRPWLRPALYGGVIATLAALVAHGTGILK